MQFAFLKNNNIIILLNINMLTNFKNEFEQLKELVQDHKKQSNNLYGKIESCFVSSKNSEQLKQLFDYIIEHQDCFTHDLNTQFRTFYLKYSYSWIGDYWFLNLEEPLSKNECYYFYSNIKEKGVKTLEKYLNKKSIPKEMFLNENNKNSISLLEYCLDEFLKSQKNYTKIKKRLIEIIIYLQKENIQINPISFTAKTNPAKFYFLNLKDMEPFFNLNNFIYEVSIQRTKYKCSIYDAILWYDFNNELSNVIKYHDIYLKRNYTLEMVINNFNTTPFFKSFIKHFLLAKTKHMKRENIRNELLSILNKIILEETFSQAKNSKKITM